MNKNWLVFFKSLIDNFRCAHQRGWSEQMDSEIARKLKQILELMGTAISLDACAIISKRGMPVSWALLDSSKSETFATLSATLMGASEVIYKTFEKDQPIFIHVRSDTNSLQVSSLGKKGLLAIIGPGDMQALDVSEERKKINEVYSFD